MEIRNKAQENVVDLFIELDMLKSCAVLSTGFGKSKVAIDIILKLKPKKVLILVNTVLLRDFNWKDEFIRWNQEKLYNSKVELVTYQTAYKWKKKDKDLSDYFVIADEVDFAADTEELSKFFYEYPKVRILGLTGFITATKRAWFEEFLPVFTELTAAKAQELKILNHLHFVFVKYDLSTNPKDILVEYKKYGEKKSFTQSECKAYDYSNKKAQSLIEKSAKLSTAFELGQISYEDMQKELKSLDYQIKKAVRERNDILLHSRSSRVMTERLLRYISTSSPKSKTIVFSKRTDQSLKMFGENMVYNGKISKKKAEKNFTAFNTGDITILGVCDKVNRGANINGLDTAILETFYGSDTEAAQRFGRLMRLKPNQFATVYILLPYYMRREINNTYTLQETQQVKWARSMLASTKIKSSTIWDYCVVKTPDNNETK